MTKMKSTLKNIMKFFCKYLPFAVAFVLGYTVCGPVCVHFGNSNNGNSDGGAWMELNCEKLEVADTRE